MVTDLSWAVPPQKDLLDALRPYLEEYTVPEDYRKVVAYLEGVKVDGIESIIDTKRLEQSLEDVIRILLIQHRYGMDMKGNVTVSDELQ